MRLNLELRQWEEKIDPSFIPEIRKIAEAQGLSYRQFLAKAIRTGLANNWIKPSTTKAETSNSV